MKKLLSVLAVSGFVAASALAYTPPTDEQIEQIVANHAQLDALVKEATPKQTADVVARAIASVQASTLTPEAKTQATALLYTRGLLLAGEKAPAMVGELSGKIDKTIVLPVGAASAAIATGSAEGPVMTSMARGAGGDADAVKNIAAAATDPVAVLGASTVALVQQLVIELRGVAAAAIAPPSVPPLTILPPLVPPVAAGAGAGTPPPASVYTGQ